MFQKVKPTRKTGDEPFTDGEAALGFRVLDFWQWSSSNLVGNALRGIVAEFLVARAVGAAEGIRNEWDSYDVTAPSGLHIEVKSAAYLQSWAQRKESVISFDVRETLAWDEETSTFAPESARCRQSHLYVFALLAHRIKATLDPLDASQWEFYLLEASTLNERVGKQRRVSLSRVLELNPVHCSYASLCHEIGRVEARLGLPRVEVDKAPGGADR